MKTVILFPGYGSQFVGMGKDLYDESRTMQEFFEEAYNCLNTNFVKLCFASSDQELAKMGNAYLSIFLTSMSFNGLLKEIGIMPSVVAGFGIGHFAALCAAQGISFPDGLYLLNKYTSFYEPMLEQNSIELVEIIGIAQEDLEKLCDKLNKKKTPLVLVASVTSTRFYVAGHQEAIAQLKENIKEQGLAKIKEVSREFGLYSLFMEEVANQLKLYLEKVDFKDMQIPVLNPMNGAILMTGAEIKQNFIEQLSVPIAWATIIDKLADYDLLIEVGPGTLLSTMLKERYPEKIVLSLNSKADIEQIKQYCIPVQKEPDGIEQQQL